MDNRSKAIQTSIMLEKESLASALHIGLQQKRHWYSQQSYADLLEKWCHDDRRGNTINDITRYRNLPWYKRGLQFLLNTNYIRQKQEALSLWQAVKTFDPIIEWKKTSYIINYSALKMSLTQESESQLLEPVQNLYTICLHT